MPATFQILPIPSGSQFTQTIGTDDPDDLNDFRALIVADQNVTGLAEVDITLSTGYSLQSFEGQNSVHAITIRPPETAGTCTVTIAANAVTEGNAETAQDIRVSTAFPDADAEAFTKLADVSAGDGIAVTPTRIITCEGSSTKTLNFYTHAGVEQTSESVTATLSGSSNFYRNNIDVLNGDLLLKQMNVINRYRLSDFSEIQADMGGADEGISHTELGVMGRVGSGEFVIQPYGTTQVSDRLVFEIQGFDIGSLFRTRSIVGLYIDGLLYFTGTASRSHRI